MLYNNGTGRWKLIKKTWKPREVLQSCKTGVLEECESNMNIKVCSHKKGIYEAHHVRYPSSSRVASWNIFTVSHHVDIILMHLIFLLASFSLNLHRRWVPNMMRYSENIPGSHSARRRKFQYNHTVRTRKGGHKDWQKFE